MLGVFLFEICVCFWCLCAVVEFLDFILFICSPFNSIQVSHLLEQQKKTEYSTSQKHILCLVFSTQKNPHNNIETTNNEIIKKNQLFLYTLTKDLIRMNKSTKEQPRTKRSSVSARAYTLDYFVNLR